MKIKTYNGATAEPQEQETVFYIQSHGFNAGRPLKNPLPNCWEVRTERSADFEILYIVFESKILTPFFRGSVIPFIALGEYKNIISPILKNAIHENRIINEHYLQIRKIEEQMQNQDKIKKLMQELKKSLSMELYKKNKFSQLKKTAPKKAVFVLVSVYKRLKNFSAALPLVACGGFYLITVKLTCSLFISRILFQKSSSNN